MRKDTSKGNGGADQSIELFITTDGELQVTRSDTLDFEILGGVASEFKNFSGQIFEDSGDVDGGC